MIGNTFQFAWEVDLIVWCQNNLPSFLVSLLKIISNVGDTVFLVGITAFFYLCYDKKLGKRILINTLYSFLLAGGIKNIFKRRRPYFDNKNISCLKIVDSNYDLYDIQKQGFSFPSMHASNITVISGTIYEYYKKKPLLFISILFSSIVGVSRFILGCHYPTDVLAGWIIGLLAIKFIGLLQDKLTSKQLNILIIVTGLIGFTFCTSSDFYTTYGIILGFITSEAIDKKYINFKNTKNVKASILRLIIGCVGFLAITEGLKLPISASILEADTLFAYAYRTFRYFAGMVVGIGLTPMLYKNKILK